MMFKKEYAIAVMQDGKIVPEKDGAVVLPYGSEYQVRLKNKSRQRSIADIYIDGKVAVKGVIVDEDGTVDIERYIRPNVDSLTGGPKFKLARLSHPGVADANDDQNGLLEVRFYKELPRKPMPNIVEISNYPSYNPPHFYYKSTITSESSDPGVFGNTKQFLSSQGGTKIGEQHDVSDYMMCDRGPSLSSNNLTLGGALRSADGKFTTKCSAAAAPAATVQGGHSSQRVENVYVEVDTSVWETLTLKLMGVTRITRMEKCPSCNHKRKNNEKFCPSCGTALVIEG